MDKMKLRSEKATVEWAPPKFPTVSPDMAKAAIKSVTIPNPNIEEFFKKFKAKHEADLFNVVDKAYKLAGEVAELIAADINRNEEIEKSKGTSERLQDILDTPIGLTDLVPQPQLLAFCVCGSGEKPPKRRRTATGIAQSYRSDEYKCSLCSSALARSEEDGRRKTLPLMNQRIKIMATQK